MGEIAFVPFLPLTRQVTVAVRETAVTGIE